jgi:hypothetical protein
MSFDCEMKPLSELFSQGKLSNAPEIAKLLKIELGDVLGVDQPAVSHAG